LETQVHTEPLINTHINTETHRYTNHTWICNRPRPPGQGSEQGPSQGLKKWGKLVSLGRRAITERIWKIKSYLSFKVLCLVRYWLVRVSVTTMNGEVVACSRGCQAFVDTGSASIYGSTGMVTNIHKVMNARPKGSEYVVSCDAVNTLPPVIFNINGVDYPLPPQAYIIKIQNSCRSIFQGGIEASSRDTCILGDVFLRQYFSVFDRKNERIGLAPAM
ncbi:hypothetical protein FD755_024441, partial [Muntiacus reevesi]